MGDADVVIENVDELGIATWVSETWRTRSGGRRFERRVAEQWRDCRLTTMYPSLDAQCLTNLGTTTQGMDKTHWKACVGEPED